MAQVCNSNTVEAETGIPEVTDQPALPNQQAPDPSERPCLKQLRWTAPEEQMPKAVF